MEYYKSLFIKILRNYGDVIDIKTLKQMQKIVNSKDYPDNKYYNLMTMLKEIHAKKVEEIKDTFIDMLDSTYNPIEICGVKWTYSEIYKCVEPLGYEIELNDFIDYMLQDLEEF